MRTLSLSALLLLSLLALDPCAARAQADSTAAATAEISADLGSCSALITVTGADSKPVYGAKISARVQYGVLGVKKLDLEAFTGVDGQVRLNKLPDSLKKPVFIHVSKGDNEQLVEFNPNKRCHATFPVQLQ